MKNKILLVLVLLCGTLHAQPGTDTTERRLPDKPVIRQVFGLLLWIPFLP